MLPLIFFTVVFGIALTRIEAGAREHFVHTVRAVQDASLQLVSWVLALAPIGVFALSVPLASRVGVSAAGAVAYYVTGVCLLQVAYGGVMYAAAWGIGRRPVSMFARAVAPAQAVAFSSRASLAALPALLQGAEGELAIPVAVRTFFLPMATAVFRTGSAIMLPFAALFAARLYGIDLSSSQLVSIALTSVLTTFTVPGIPGGSVIVMVPVLLSAGLPVGAVGLLLGVDTIPDMFRTAGHVTADMAVATVLARWEPEEGTVNEAGTSRAAVGDSQSLMRG